MPEEDKPQAIISHAVGAVFGGWSAAITHFGINAYEGASDDDLMDDDTFW